MSEVSEASRQPQIIGVACMLLFLSTVAVALRLLFRRTTGMSLWWDDYVIIVALVLSWVSPICNLVGLRYGLGKHASSLPPEKIIQYDKVLYAFEVVWTFTVPFIKLSVLLLYNRLFPVRPVRLATLSIGFFVTTWLLWAGIATIAQCIPIEYFWNRDIPGHCINNNAFYISAGAVNVFTSFAIISIPIPIIWRLQKLNVTQKIGFTSIFTLGGWVCIISIIRLVYIGRLSPTDITWTDAWGGMWSSMEVSFDVVGACLPVIAPGFYKLIRTHNFSWVHLLTRRSNSKEPTYSDLEAKRKTPKESHSMQGVSRAKDVEPDKAKGMESKEELEMGRRPSGVVPVEQV